MQLPPCDIFSVKIEEARQATRQEELKMQSRMLDMMSAVFQTLEDLKKKE